MSKEHPPIADAVVLSHTALDLATDLEGLRSRGAVNERFQLFAEAMGFSSVACFKVPDPGQSLESCLHMCTRPQAWCDRYIDQDYVRVDPLVREATQSDRSQFALDARATRGTARGNS